MPKQNRVPLEDLMISMDVVDTLRHREIMVDRELNTENRRKKLIEKLRDIYSSQGIEVTDKMLEEGVQALEEERFSFTPEPKGFTAWLALLYVTRDKWLKPLFTGVGVIAVASIAYYMLSVRPQQIEKENLPITLDSQYKKVIKESNDPKATKLAQELNGIAKEALVEDEREVVKDKINALKTLLERLKQSYTVQIVQGIGQRSGIWRVPPGSENGKNYYLIVEGVNAQGEKVNVQMKNEENNQNMEVTSWGIRVNEFTYNQVALDKSDDGIIQKREVGVKKSGYLYPEYSIETTGATITKW